MSLSELLAELEARGVRPILTRGKLRLRGPGDRLTPELIERVRRYRTELLGYLGVQLTPEPACSPLVSATALRKCGALICKTCSAQGPTPHRSSCPDDYSPCGCRWFWMSRYRAMKCVACATPFDLASVEGWVLARETGEGEDGFGIPEQILSVLGWRGSA
jgi:hypothetical protein